MTKLVILPNEPIYDKTLPKNASCLWPPALTHKNKRARKPNYALHKQTKALAGNKM